METRGLLPDKKGPELESQLGAKSEFDSDIETAALPGVAARRFDACMRRQYNTQRPGTLEEPGVAPTASLSLVVRPTGAPA